MHFIHQPYKAGDTIAAVATPSGNGGVAIIRISGDMAFDVASKIFDGDVYSYKSHTCHFGKIYDSEKKHVDDVLLLVFKGKRSFTGENTVEIHCHGGSLITKKVLEVVIEAGARQAMPGEFSFKAFMNGKMDLAQAEAIQELISAKSERALKAADRQLEGALSKQITAFQKELTDIAAILEAWVDFPEEGLEFASMDEVLLSLKTVDRKLQHLLKTFHDGKIVHEGVSMALIGAPNVGKSSLMNALLKKDRAIVSDIPGTTRDVLEDHMRFGELNFKLVDTAGIRESSDLIEAEGIRRSKKAINEADLILFVVDCSLGWRDSEKKLAEGLSLDKTIVVWNKTDLGDPAFQECAFPHQLGISAKEIKGLEALKAMIDKVIWTDGPPSQDEVLITSSRHKESLEHALTSLLKVIDGLESNLSPEFLTHDLRVSLQNLGKVIGQDVSEEILSAIFSKFCIGK